MRDLLEKMSFAGQAVGQKPGDQVRGSEPMPRKGGGKKHPFQGRLVGGGAAESAEPYCDGCDRLAKDCICDEPTAESLQEEFERFIAEYGAPGTAISMNVGQDPHELAAIRKQQVAAKSDISNQVAGLNAQITGLRSQLSQLNRSFPQGANPVEKAMSLKDIQAQKVGINGQIEDLTKQISALKMQG
jgi:hypothetical protein